LINKLDKLGIGAGWRPIDIKNPYILSIFFPEEIKGKEKEVEEILKEYNLELPK
jgi:hypothetical protein